MSDTFNGCTYRHVSVHQRNSKKKEEKNCTDVTDNFKHLDCMFNNCRYVLEMHEWKIARSSLHKEGHVRLLACS